MPRTTPPVATPQVSKADAIDTLPTAFLADLPAMCADGRAKGADLCRLMVAHGLIEALPATATKTSDARTGFVLRTYMRSHGAWVGRGHTYGMTVAEARSIAAGFVGKVAPAKGVRYAKGRLVVKDEATA